MLVEGRHFLSTVPPDRLGAQGARRQPERPGRLRRAAGRVHARPRPAARRRRVPRPDSRAACSRSPIARLRADRRRHDARPARDLHHGLRRAARAARRCCARARAPATISTSSGTLGDARLALEVVSRPGLARRRCLRPGAQGDGAARAAHRAGHAPARRRDQRHRHLRRPGRRPRPRAAPLGRRRRASTSTRCRAAPFSPRSRSPCSANACSPAATTTSWCSRRCRRVATPSARRPRAAGIAVTRIGRIEAGDGAAPRRPQRRRAWRASSARSTTSAPEPRRFAAVNAEPALHPPLAGAGRRPGWRFLLSHPAHAVALGFGSGLAPCAPGTAGTLWAWLVYVVARAVPRRRRTRSRPCRRRADRLVGLHRDGAPPRPGRSRRRSSGTRSIAFWLVLWLVTPASFLAPGGRLRALSRLRCRQARPGRLGRPALQAAPRRADRLGARLRHPVRRLRRGAVHPVVIAAWRFL